MILRAASVMKIVLALVVVLIVMTVMVRLVESRFAFFPFAGETTTPQQFGVQDETLTISTDDGERGCFSPGAVLDLPLSRRRVHAARDLPCAGDARRP